MTFLLAAMLALWALLFGYVFLLARKQARLERDLEQRLLARDDQG